MRQFYLCNGQAKTLVASELFEGGGGGKREGGPPNQCFLGTDPVLNDVEAEHILPVTSLPANCLRRSRCTESKSCRIVYSHYVSVDAIVLQHEDCLTISCEELYIE